jgi:predicted RNase H-like HicB family nuclease
MEDYPINIFYSDVDKGYIEDIPDQDACSAFGKTSTDVLKQAQLDKKVWLEAAQVVGNSSPNSITDLPSTEPARKIKRFPL